VDLAGKYGTSCHDIPVFGLGELPSTCSEKHGQNDDWGKKSEEIIE